MTISAFDLFVLGALVSFGGVMLIVKGYWGPDVYGRTMLYAGTASSCLIRSQIIRHSHAMAGVRWMTVGMLAFVIGATRGEHMVYFFGPWVDVGLHLGVLSVSWLATAARTRSLSRRSYLPKMIDRHREEFGLYLEYLSNKGYHRSELDQRVAVPDTTRQQRLAEATVGLDHLGTLIDVPRRADERDVQYAERLHPWFRPTPKG